MTGVHPAISRRERLGRAVQNWTFVLLGANFLALGVVLFLAPNGVATGGTPGLSILLQRLTGLSLGTLMLLINVPLLLLGYRDLGRAFCVRTIVTTVLCSVLVDFYGVTLALPATSDELLLAALFGGVLIGLGVGCILRGDSSSGGSTLVARILRKRFGIPPGRTILAFDVFIIASSAAVFRGIEPSLWSLISIYTTSRCIDLVLAGSVSESVVHIVTDRIAAVSEAVRAEFGREGTIVEGVGMSDGRRKTMLFLVVGRRRVAQLRRVVRDEDPEAFLVVMEASELMGRGH